MRNKKVQSANIKNQSLEQSSKIFSVSGFGF